MPDKQKIRIMIADDHVLIREGLKQIFLRSPDMELIAETGELDKVIPTISHHLPLDVLLLDLSFGEQTSLQILPKIRQQFSERPRVLILTVHSGAQYAGQCLSTGAHGFIQKDVEPQHLLHAIRQVHAGQIYADTGVKEQIENVRSKGKRTQRSLSSREREVLIHLAKGKSTIEISESLGLSPNTVKTYRSRLLDKLGFRNEADLIRYALANDLFDKPRQPYN
ncbi:MAG TPA: response regulator transcription factor [Acidobacteriota bacterium]|nr:response regulator transcription factor [Acidobacteriota bacterium]